MRRISVKTALLPIFSTLLALSFSLNAFGDDPTEISIEVAPNVLNLQSQGEVVTVHTDVPFASVYATSVFLNDVAIAWWKADNQGNFVAKFWMEEIKSLVEDEDNPLFVGEDNLLTLIGVKDDGNGGISFFGEALIMVIDNKPTGKAKR